MSTTLSRPRIAVALACTLPLLAACAGDVTSPDDTDVRAAFTAAADPPQVPFRLTVTSSSETAAPGGRCGAFPMITVDISGTAVSTLLGRTTLVQSHCIDATDTSGAFTNGQFTETGADGSTISGTYFGVLVPTSDPTVFEIQGTFTITGGTRRLAGATGGGVATGTINVVTGALTLELNGTVSSVGSLK